MTTHILSISTIRTEFGTKITSQPADITVLQGDTVEFRWGLHEGSEEPSYITVSGLDSGVFGSPSSFNLNAPNNVPVSRNVAVNATLGVDQVTFSPSDIGYPSKTVNITVDTSLDQDPAPFNLGDNIDNVNPSQVIEGRRFSVTGLSTGANAPVSITGGQYSKNGGSWTSIAGTINNSDTIKTRITASSSFNTTVSCTLTIGSVSDSWSVTTRADPGSGNLIPFGFNDPNDDMILRDDIGEFYGFRFNVSPFGSRLADYVRGGEYVPDIPQNSGVPTAPPITMDDMRGSYMSIYFEKLPTFKAASHDSTGSGTTLDLGWSTLEEPIESSDFYVGYGIGARNVCEYRYTVTGLSSNGVYVTSSNYGTFSIANKTIVLALDVSQGQAEQQYTGTITIEVRHPADPTEILTTNVDYSFFVFGE